MAGKLAGAMIHDVDETLRALIDAKVANGSEVDVSFDSPTKDWAARQNKPTISSFLYDIREDVARRDVAPRLIKDDAGRTIGRKPPVRRFRLSYLLTAWTQQPQDEHRLLSQLLSSFLAFDEIPAEYLSGSLVDADVPTIITLALPPGQDRSLSDVWGALGGELKPSLDLVVVAPLEPGRSFETGPPVLEMPRLRVGDFTVDPDDVGAERAARKGVPLGVPVEEVEEDPSADRLQVGSDEHPGRTFVIERKPR